MAAKQQRLYRDWFKAPTFLLDDPRFRRLDFEQQGIWWRALLYSLRSSEIPGTFISQADSTPLAIDDIAFGLSAYDERDVGTVRRAFEAFVRSELMTHTPEDGFSVTRWLDVYGTEKQQTEVREQARLRQQRRRGRMRTTLQPDEPPAEIVDLERLRQSGRRVER